MPDAIIVKDVALTQFAHREPVQFVFVIVGDDNFAALSTAPRQQVRGDIFFPIFVQTWRTCVTRPARRSREPDYITCMLTKYLVPTDESGKDRRWYAIS